MDMILGPSVIWYGDVFGTKAHHILVLHGGFDQKQELSLPRKALFGEGKKSLGAGSSEFRAKDRHLESIVSNYVESPRVRNPAMAGNESIHLDYLQPKTIDPALEGTRGLLLMAPPLDPEAPAKMKPVTGRVKKVGISQVVFIPALGVNFNEQAPLRIVEHQVMDSGIPYAILRPNFFMENFSEGFLSGTIKSQNGIFLAAGEGRTSLISVRDIAAVVATRFLQATPIWSEAAPGRHSTSSPSIRQ